MPNPFFYGGRVEPEQFIGRRAELQRIFAGLEVAHTGQMQSFSVVGPRRIGKSSLLFYVAQRYARYLHDAAPYRFAYIELQDAHCHTLTGLLDGILKQLGAGQLVGNAPPLVEFQDAILALKARDILPVVCLDEFEELIHHRDQFTFDFYESWRFLMNQHALAFITASKVPLIDLAQTLGYTSPFFNIFTHLTLGEFTDAEARELIARGAACDRPFTPTEQNELLLLAGKHPYKLQLAGSLLYLAKGESGTVDWAELRRAFQQQCELAGLETPIQKTLRARIGAALRWLFALPELLGRAILEGLLRLKKDDVSETTAWIVGAVLLVVLVLILLGYVSVNLEDALKLVERLRGK
jgi:uncharacterized membrane protein (Fun14 family)